MDGCDSPQSRDQAIKLFGREIPLPGSKIPSKPKSMDINNDTTKLDKSSALPSAKEEHITSAELIDTHANYSSQPNEDPSDTNDTEQEKVFKKPDKILPCPRCNSLDTKFCYFNNYNVNQPRHFCKNCQRYWTAGGTMRNVPIGAGRRKNKQFASQYRQILVSPDGTPLTKIEIHDSANHQVMSSLTGNGTVLKFGPEAPLCKSMDSVLQLGDQKNDAVLSAVNIREQELELSALGLSSVTASTSQSNDVPLNVLGKEQIGLQVICNDSNPQNCLPFYPVPPLGSPPLYPSWNNAVGVNTNCWNSNPVQFSSAPVMAIPGVFPHNIPLQFVPASYLACRPVLGNFSFFATNGNCSSPSASTSNSCCSGSCGSPTLGKHSRDPSSITEETQSEKYVLVPKTLRIDDPDASSKSPIWATLGIVPDHAKGAFFKGSELKAEGTDVLEVNPAALSRSHTFQEGM